VIKPRDDVALMPGYHSPQVEVDVRLNTNESPAAPPEAWRTATFMGGATLPLTADELKSIGEAMRAALIPYVARLTDRGIALGAWRSAGGCAETRILHAMRANTPKTR